MKKYFVLIVLSLIVGFCLSFFVINEYSNKQGITVYKEGQKLYFFKYGEFNSEDDMYNNTIGLENYIYKRDDNKYNVYIAITKNENNFHKIKEYYSDYDLSIEEFFISNTEFVNVITNLDSILTTTSDNIAIGEIINQELSSYDKVVLHERKD